MIIRFVINNILSFGEEKEFNLLSNTRLKTLQHHIYNTNSLGILKLGVIYGANAAGKSNLIRCLSLLRDLVLKENIPIKLKNGQFKFQAEKETKPQLFAVEFVEDNEVLYYGVEILNGIIRTEELYKSGVGITADELIFERKTNDNLESTVQFSQAFEQYEKNQLLKSLLLEEFIEPHKPILKWVATKKNPLLAIAKKAYNWFKNTLVIIEPETKPIALTQRLDIDDNFRKYANDIMCSFHIGINDLFVKKQNIEEILEEDAKQQIMEKMKGDTNIIGLKTKHNNELLFVKEGKEIVAKQLHITHVGKNNISATFDLEEESDGTLRLLDLVPAFKDLTQNKKVYVIDELERSLHPLLIKNLVAKFASDQNTNGQLIFTTHESNLLDQNIFRQDEIWFAEKDDTGSTDLYTLSSFKEHKTIDIQRGYLNGRYGSIPFLSNLQDLNWHDYAPQK